MSQLWSATGASFQLNPNKQQASQDAKVCLCHLCESHHVETCLNTEWCSTPMRYHSLPYGQNNHTLDFFQGTMPQESQIVAKILPAHLLLK